jgi:hypothetical protein
VEQICPFCRRDADVREFKSQARQPWRVDCEDCGTYAIHEFALVDLKKQPALSNGLLNLIQATLQLQSPVLGEVSVMWKQRSMPLQNTEGLPATIYDIEDWLDRPIRHAEKTEALMRLFARRLSKSGPFSEVKFSIKDIRGLGIASWQELFVWMKVLHEKGWIGDLSFKRWNVPGLPPGTILPMPLVGLTPDGWDHVESLYGPAGSRDCFIAMSFRLPNFAEVLGAIQEACRRTNWEGRTVAEREYTGAVMDRVISEINRARFVVADFTEQRGGVYYEAGYAEGRGIPVIYTVRADEMDNVHFDTKHLNYINWKSLDDLRDRLVARIGAVINK